MRRETSLAFGGLLVAACGSESTETCGVQQAALSTTIVGDADGDGKVSLTRESPTVETTDWIFADPGVIGSRSYPAAIWRAPFPRGFGGRRVGELEARAAALVVDLGAHDLRSLPDMAGLGLGSELVEAAFTTRDGKTLSGAPVVSGHAPHTP